MRTGLSSSMRALAWVSLILASSTPLVWGVVCSPDPAPASTLLIPYVELDTSSCGPTPGANTRVNVTNAVSAPTLVHVTLWTDMAVPVIDFDVYLAGFDSQVLDLHEILCLGNLPVTGMAVSPHGSFSDAPVTFSSCNNTTTPGDPPVFDNPALTAVYREHAQAYMRGEPSPLMGNCGGWPHGDQVARGYMTIDVVTDCSIKFPNDETYFSEGVIGFDNRLLGWFTLADGAGRVDTYTAVHVEAAPATFQAGDVTFYGRYTPAASPAADNREPLPTTWAAQYEGASTGSVPLLVWREVVQLGLGFDCATIPAWHPLPMSMDVGGGPFTSFDDSGAAVTVTTGLALASQRVGVGTSLPARGWLYANLQHPQTTVGPGQGWVSLDRAAAAAALEAIPLDSACNRNNMSVTRPGTTSSNPPNWVVPVELMGLIVQ